MKRPTSIASTEYLRLGGVPQWVTIRGDDVSNPPLVILHGGPGMSDAAFFRYFQPSLEESFTVVHWDQRGTGKSFSRDIPRASMTVAQLVSDLDELVGAVLARVGGARVALLGHSWGGALGVLYASRFASKVEAYVGVAQPGDWATAELASYSWALEEARRQGADRIERRLHAIGPPPHDAKNLLIERRCTSRLELRLSRKSTLDAMRALLFAPDASLRNVPKALRGFRFSLDTMWPEVSRLNLIEAVPELTMPVFFFVGGRDHWIPSAATVAYFDALRAPAKTLVWFDASGHEPFVDEPAKFGATMRDLVRPMLRRHAAPSRAA